MHCFRFADVMINAMIINTFNSDNNKMTDIVKSWQTLQTESLKFKPVIKKPIVAEKNIIYCCYF